MSDNIFSVLTIVGFCYNTSTNPSMRLFGPRAVVLATEAIESNKGGAIVQELVVLEQK